MKHRLCSLVLLCALVLTLTGCGAKTVASGNCGEHLTWTLDERGKLTISAKEVRKAEADIMEEYDFERMDVFDDIEVYLGLMDDYDSQLPPWGDYREKIKSVVVENGVSSIGEGAFSDCTALESVKLANSVTYILNSAFSGCSGLKSIHFSPDTKFIGAYAFCDCESLKDFSLPKTVETLGEYAFFRCTAIEDLTVPEGVNEIGMATFYECTSLQSITIPASVTIIDMTAFMGCSSLGDVTYMGTREQWNDATRGYGDLLKDCTGTYTLLHTE